MNKNSILPALMPLRFFELASTFALSCAIVLYFAFLPSIAHATINATIIGYPVGAIDKTNYITNIANSAFGIMSGTTGRALCAIAVIAAGLGALFGRVTWIQAVIVTFAVGAVYGASNIFHMLSGSTDLAPTIIYGSGSVGITTCDNLDMLGMLTSGLPLNRVCDMLRNTINAISGGTGAAIATLCVLFLGLAALFGKATVPQAVVLSFGIALIFGSLQIIRLLWTDPGDCLLNQVYNLLALSNQTEFVMCRFLAELRGDAGKFLATLVVIVMGFLALLGRLSWTVGIITMVGMAMVFGSEQIVNILVPTAFNCNTFYTYSYSFASTQAIESVLCNVLNLATGPAGKALASATIVMLGFGAMLGKISYSAALVTASGIAIAFGAPQIVFILTGMIDMCALSATIGGTLNVCSTIR